MARLLVALAAVAMVASTASGAGLLVQTTSGPVMGMETEAALTWRGIPYATPPVGPMRWQDSVPPTPWTEPREAFAFGPACPQKCELPPTTCQPLMDEDCLFLNVYSPIGVTGAPVMVFFHGGRYEQGSTGVELYDGQLLANITSTVVVTANYRIGALGFMTLGPFTGNYGVKDQRLTLEWVQANIRGFGGDPTSVTIFGQSAGGTSVSFHLVAPKSFPLYHRAVVQSSPFSLPVLDLATAQLHYAHLANETQCKSPDPQCLLEQTWFDIVAAQTAAQQKIYPNRPLASFYPWIPHVDGQDLTSDPLTMFQEGSFNRVPIMTGHVFQEGTLFIYDAFGSPIPKGEMHLLIDFMFQERDLPKELFETYPLPANTSDLRGWVSDVTSDFIFKCTDRNLSRIVTSAGMPVYRYEFNHVWSVPSGWGPVYTYCYDAVCHGAELPFIFNSASLVGFNFTAAENALSSTMAKYWANFARTGSPNGPGLPVWPAHDPATDVLLSLGTDTIAPITQLRKPECDFWDKFGYIQA